MDLDISFLIFCKIWIFYSFYWINLNLDWISISNVCASVFILQETAMRSFYIADNPALYYLTEVAESGKISRFMIST